MDICIVLGTRPELIKCSILIKELEQRNINYKIYNTNQHYDENMSKNFFEELGIDINNVITYGDKFSFGHVVDWLNVCFRFFKYDVCFVQGDTNSALAGALASKFNKIKLAHIEAGIRSYDSSMQEEVNRQMIGRIADYHFCPTEEAKYNLLKENITENIFIVGNTIVDAINHYSKLDIENEYCNYILLTMHRAELVDNKELLTKVIKWINKVSEEQGLKVLYPIHPRTKKMIENYEIDLGNRIHTIEPVGYVEMLNLQKDSFFIITDSGGIQEESCILEIPCFTIRDNTERPETLGLNNRLIEVSKIDEYLNKETLPMLTFGYEIPYGDGKSSSKMVEIVSKRR